VDLKERGSTSRRHPWEVARARHVLAWIAAYGANRAQLDPAGARILDAGSGDSYVAGEVCAALPGATATGWDLHYSEQDLRQAPAGVTRVRDEPDGQFDILLALDVIEHVEDDDKFLRTLLDHAAPDALLVVTVPAYQGLFSKHDVYLGHYRRYSQRQLRAVLEHAGWTPRVLTGFFTSLLPVRAATSALERREPQVDADAEPKAHLGTWSRGAALTCVVQAALAADAALARAVARRTGRGVPGLSVGAVAVPRR
jgi:SAM-dependent methyltransferase